VHKILTDIGAVPSPRERYTLLNGGSQSGHPGFDLLGDLATLSPEDTQDAPVNEGG
jgi:hypothetical protein